MQAKSQFKIWTQIRQGEFDITKVPNKGVTILEYVIEMLGIRKEFGDFVANNNITLQLEKAKSTRY